MTKRPKVKWLEGTAVMLRPFAADEVQVVLKGQRRLDARAIPMTPKGNDVLKRQLERSGELHRGRLDLAIETGGRLVGQIQARTRPDQALPPGVFELGVAIWDPTDRGMGYGSEAVALLTRWLFKECAAGRVQAGTETSNTAMRRALEKLGFALEGVMRAYMPTDRGRQDYALYAATAEESNWKRT